MTHVPYSSAAPTIQAVTGRQVPIGLTAMPPTVELIKSGKIRGIAVTSLARMPSLPDVSTVAESGFPGYDDYTWIGFFAPTGTPRAIVKQLNDQIAAILQLPDTKKRLAVLGFDAVETHRSSSPITSGSKSRNGRKSSNSQVRAWTSVSDRAARAHFVDVFRHALHTRRIRAIAIRSSSKRLTPATHHSPAL